MGKVSRIPTIGDYTIFFNSLFFVLYSERSYITPALHRTMFGKQLAFGNFLLFARYLQGKTDFPLFYDFSEVPEELVAEAKRISDSLTVAIRWKAGDLLILDNTRFLHGRNSILDIDERRILSYFGYLKFAELSEAEANAEWRQGNTLTSPQRHPQKPSWPAWATMMLRVFTPRRRWVDR